MLNNLHPYKHSAFLHSINIFLLLTAKTYLHNAVGMLRQQKYGNGRQSAFAKKMEQIASSEHKKYSNLISQSIQFMYDTKYIYYEI